jgi:hypothetical protein
MVGWPCTSVGIGIVSEVPLVPLAEWWMPPFWGGGGGGVKKKCGQKSGGVVFLGKNVEGGGVFLGGFGGFWEEIHKRK